MTERQTREQHVTEGTLRAANIPYIPPRDLDNAYALTQAIAKAHANKASQQKAAEEALRHTNPLGITCVECFNLCVLSRDGKRWLCQWGHDNGRMTEDAWFEMATE